MRCGAGVRTCFACGGPQFRSQPRGPTRVCPRRPRPSGARGGGETAIARRPRGVAPPPPRGQGAARPGSEATPGARPEHQPGAHISTSQMLHVSYMAPQDVASTPQGRHDVARHQTLPVGHRAACHDAPGYGGPPDGGPHGGGGIAVCEDALLSRSHRRWQVPAPCLAYCFWCDCPGRKPPFWVVKRPVHSYKNA